MWIVELAFIGDDLMVQTIDILGGQNVQLVLSIQDFWTLGSMLNYFESVISNPNTVTVDTIQDFTESYTGNLRSEYGFRIMSIWFAETYIFLNTAWDAFDRSDERPKQPIAMTGGSYRHI